MREFRAAPAKLLARAARTGAALHLGTYVLSVREATTESQPSYGAMAATGRVVGPPSGLFSADDEWSADGGDGGEEARRGG